MICMKDLELATSKPCTAWYWVIKSDSCRPNLGWGRVELSRQSWSKPWDDCAFMWTSWGYLRKFEIRFWKKRSTFLRFRPKNPVRRRPYPRSFAKENQLGKFSSFCINRLHKHQFFLTSGALHWFGELRLSRSGWGVSGARWPTVSPGKTNTQGFFGGEGNFQGQDAFFGVERTMKNDESKSWSSSL